MNTKASQGIPLSFEMRMSTSNSLHKMNTVHKHVPILDGESIIIFQTTPQSKHIYLLLTVRRRTLTPHFHNTCSILAAVNQKSSHFMSLKRKLGLGK